MHSHICSVVLSEVKDDAPLPLQAIKLLATYLAEAEAPATKTSSSGKQRALLALEDLLSDAGAASHPVVQLVAATVYLHEAQYAAALKVLRGGASLEHLALTVQVQLRLDRPDLAEATVKSMQSIDDEAALTSISAGLVALVQGGDRIKEASLIYKEMLDRFGRSNAALNGLASAYIAMRRFDDAEKALNDALESDPESADTLANVVTLLVQAGKTGKSYMDAVAKLRAVAPTHPYVEAIGRAEDMFDRVAASYGV